MLGEWYLPPGKCQAISTITEGIISISHPAPLSSQTRIPQTSSPLVDKSQATQAALLQIRRSEADRKDDRHRHRGRLTLGEHECGSALRGSGRGMGQPLDAERASSPACCIRAIRAAVHRLPGFHEIEVRLRRAKVPGKECLSDCEAQESVPKGGSRTNKGMNPKPYPSDLTSQQWAVLKPFLPPARTGGRPRKTEMRSVVNAIFYRNRNGCIWRALPHDFPPWRTVYNYFAAWKRDGTWKAINDALRRRVRRRAGRQPTPMPAVSIARPSRRPKGVASMVTTVPSGSPVGSIISPWIPWGCF